MHGELGVDDGAVPSVPRSWRRGCRTIGSVRTTAQDGVMTKPTEAPDGDYRARYVAAFLGGVRAAAAQRQHFRWTAAYAERAVTLCDRTEQLGLPAAYLVVQLSCGRNSVSFEDALATVEAVLRPAETA
jgi:hypothetical protein